MSPVSPVFHTVETMRIALNLKKPTLENKMSMLVSKAFKLYLSFSPSASKVKIKYPKQKIYSEKIN